MKAEKFWTLMALVLLCAVVVLLWGDGAESVKRKWLFTKREDELQRLASLFTEMGDTKDPSHERKMTYLKGRWNRWNKNHPTAEITTEDFRLAVRLARSEALLLSDDVDIGIITFLTLCLFGYMAHCLDERKRHGEDEIGRNPDVWHLWYKVHLVGVAFDVVVLALVGLDVLGDKIGRRWSWFQPMPILADLGFFTVVGCGWLFWILVLDMARGQKGLLRATWSYRWKAAFAPLLPVGLVMSLGTWCHSGVLGVQDVVAIGVFVTVAGGFALGWLALGPLLTKGCEGGRRELLFRVLVGLIPTGAALLWLWGGRSFDWTDWGLYVFVALFVIPAIGAICGFVLPALLRHVATHDFMSSSDSLWSGWRTLFLLVLVAWPLVFLNTWWDDRLEFALFPLVFWAVAPAALPAWLVGWAGFITLPAFERRQRG